jgi:hypothetical protein
MQDDKKYDGFYFMPGEEEGEVRYSFFKMNDGHAGNPIESTVIGDKFHVAFFQEDEEGNPIFDEDFEAIFSDPYVYVSGLTDLYGCVLRKTDKSHVWWEEYLERAKTECVKMIGKTTKVCRNT